ncbi:MAG TPA: DUF2058 domain-containing protein [Deferrisomatales bacterium]|nr:DUF2058 domain-containing protein [Deferrisomatales bacterium]
MGGSLRDQLLKAGLVDEKRAKKAKHADKQQHRQALKARKSGQKPPQTETAQAAERARQEREMHAQLSRELNRERDASHALKALRTEVRKLLEQHSQPFDRGDVRYNFAENGKIKRIYVTRKQQQALATGELAIASWDGRHLLVPAEVGRRVLEKLPDTVVVIAQPETVDPDDPYAAFPIPDDLEW